MAVAVRRARASELDRVGELTAQVYADEGFAGEEYLPRLRDARRRATGAEVLVAVESDALLGSATYTTYGGGPYADLAQSGEAELRMLVVDPAARGRGVGAALVAAALARARADGQDWLVLSTQPGMIAAGRLYHRLGFDRMPERDWAPYPTMPLHAYRLNTGFTVRPAVPADYAALGTLTIAAYRRRPGGLRDEAYADRLRDVAARAECGAVLVAVDGAGQLLGGVSVLPGPGPMTALARVGEAEVRTLAVEPSAQRRGVGAALIVAAESAARTAGAARAVLCTPTENWIARHLYERYGWLRDPGRDVARPPLTLATFVRDL